MPTKFFHIILSAGMNYVRQYGLEENRATLELLLMKQ